MSNSPVTVGHPFSGWRWLQVGPGSKGQWRCPEERAPVCPGEWLPALPETPASSLSGLARSWGHTGDVPWWEIFLKKANSRPIWVCSAFRKDPSPPRGTAVQAPDSAGRSSLVLLTLPSSLPAQASLPPLSCSHSPASSSQSKLWFTFRVNQNACSTIKIHPSLTCAETGGSA